MLSLKLQQIQGQFFNYKKTYSNFFMGICNARYQLTIADIGDSGRQSDGSVYTNSSLDYTTGSKQPKLLPEKDLRCSQRNLPYVLVGNDIFGLKPRIMKLHPSQNLPIYQRVLIIAFRVVANKRKCIKLCASRFLVLRGPIIASPKK